jgi:hypothetical protein
VGTCRRGHRICDSTGLCVSYREVGPMTFQPEMGECSALAATGYAEFIARKTQRGADHGFAPVWMPDFLYPFQQALTEWSILKGRGAMFADCGLGKTPMQLVWAENVVRHTNRSVLILTPLAVAQQTVREAEKFGIEARRSAGKIETGAHIVVTNYEKLAHFSPDDFSAVVCDESSAIKAFNGARRAEVTAFMRHVPYRLLCTATAAPNDYVELGTSSEALGELGQMDMLGRFFVNDQNNCSTRSAYRTTGGGAPKWRFKGHAETPFWRWVCSWARAMRKPSDLGFDDSGFALPPLVEREHIVETRTKAPGMLFSLPASNMQEEREERRRTIVERCEMVADLVQNTGQPFVSWCHLNDEGDMLADMIKDCRQVSGQDSDEAKEEAYQDFASGAVRGIVTKPKIGAFGLNWQHCAHVVSFASHSYEQYYQSVRRCWRFGQKRPVVVDLVVTEGEQGVKDNLRRKSEAADRMFSELVAHMNDAMGIARGARFEKEVEAPRWL